MTTASDSATLFSLLPQQRRLFTLDMFGAATAYNFPLAYEVNGPVDATRLEAAFKTVVARRSVYRARFAMVDGVPMQRILEAAPFALETMDKPGAAVQELVQDFVRPFDLSADTLLRGRLVALEAGRHVLLIDMHHIVTDLHSIDLLLDDLACAYRGDALRDIPLDYREYLERLPSYLATEDEVARQGKFWAALYEGGANVPKLPTDHERPVLQGFHGAHRWFTLGAHEMSALKAQAAALGVDTRSFLMAAYHTLLAKLCSEDDVIAGCINTGRRHPDLEHVQTMFVKTQAIRSRPRAQRSFASHAAELHHTLVQAGENADYGIDRLIEHLNVPRDASRNPLFDAMFLLKPEGQGQLRLQGCDVRPQRFESGLSKFDLTFIAQEADGGLNACFEYNTRLYDTATVERFERQFRTLLAHAVANPEQRIADLSLMTREEQDAVWERSKNVTVHASGEHMHTLFHRAVAEHPQQIAIESPRRNLSYRQLGACVNRLARRLRALGVDKGSFVAVVSDHGWEQAAATQAILTAGGAYVPINPELPRNRVLHLLEVCDIRVVLTQSCHEHAIEWPQGVQVLCVDRDEGYAGESDAPHPVYQGLDDIAYIIFTSGTTGTPKGVVIEHRAAVNTLLDVNRRFQVGPGDKVLALSNLNFDLSVYDIFGLLAAGGTVVYPDHAQAKSPPHWLELVHAHQVTLWNTVPALMSLLCDSASRAADARPLPLRGVMMSGDWIPVTLPETIRALCRPGVSINSLGGATEASIWSIWHPIDGSEAGAKRIPYGRAMDNQSFFVLDAALNPCPVGVVGDLYIGGIGLAREYWRDAQKTNASFLVHPTRGERIYCTGDIGRYLGDGNIEILGRRDHQVKINGYRIELEEIESFLLKYPGVRQAAVAVHSHDGTNVLCAYLVQEAPPAPGEEAGNRALIDFLGEFLPEYMVPLHYLHLDSLPLGANDKVDRAALPKPELAPVKQEYLAPRNEVEAALVEIWQTVLREPAIGVHDNFFRLGGDSIKAIQIASRLRERGYGLRVDDLFRYGTIAELAPNLKVAARIQEEQVAGAVPFTPICHWFMDLDLTEPHHWNQDIVVTRADRFDVPALEQALNALFVQHDLLRAVLAEDGRSLDVKPADAFCFELEEHELSGFIDAEARMLQECDRLQAGIDWRAGPLVKVALFHLSEADKLVVIAHHLLVDGISWRVIVEDLERACLQAEAGQSVKLPGKTHSVRKWVEALNRHAASPALRAEFDHWRSACEGDGQDAARTRTRIRDARTHVVQLDHGHTEKLQKAIHHAYNTEINDVLMAALAWALGEPSREGSVLVQMEGHGREDIEDGLDISRTVGWFTTAYPVRLAVGRGDLARLIPQTKEALRRIPKKGIGYGVLRYLADIDPAQRQQLRYVPRLNFNYLGEMGGAAGNGPFQYAFSGGGERRSPRSELLCPLDMQCLVTGGALHTRFVYDPQTWSPASIEALGADFLAALMKVIEHCESRTQSAYTPSDFELAGVDQDELDQLVRSF